MINRVRSVRFNAGLGAVGILTAASPCASTDRYDQETYRCAAPYGRADGLVLRATGDDVTISGKVIMHTADIGPRWGSVGKIILRQHDARYSDGDCGCNGIEVFAYKNPDHIEFYMAANGKNIPIARSPFATPITFKLMIDAKGLMTAAIGKSQPEVKTVILRHPAHNTLELTCSGADVSFLGVAMS